MWLKREAIALLIKQHFLFNCFTVAPRPMFMIVYFITVAPFVENPLSDCSLCISGGDEDASVYRGRV